MTYVHVADVQDSGVELEAQSLGLLDRVGQLAVGLQREATGPCGQAPMEAGTHPEVVPCSQAPQVGGAEAKRTNKSKPRKMTLFAGQN